MKDDSASYYESKEFINILNAFENMLTNGESIYLDSLDVANIAEFYSMNGQRERSNLAIEYGLKLHPANSDILIAKASCLLRQGKRSEARVIAESIDDTHNYELRYIKGCIELEEENIECAESLFQHSIEAGNEDLNMMNDIIVKYMDCRQFELCQKWLDRALLLSPDSRNFIELQADLYYDSDQIDSAIEWYNHLLDEFAYDTYYWEQLGRIYFEKQSDFVKAYECFVFMEDIDPGNKTARIMKAACKFNQEEWQEALEIYLDLMDDEASTEYTLRYYASRCLFEMEKFDEAFDMFLETLSMIMLDDAVIQEMYVELYYYLSYCALYKQSIPTAEYYLHEGMALEPNNEDLKNLAHDIELFKNNNKLDK